MDMMSEMILMEETSICQTRTISQILNDLYYHYGIRRVYICHCGAFTFEKDGRSDVSVKIENAAKYFPLISQNDFYELSTKMVPEYVNCNHCVNHWGLDLCHCGSGEFVEECGNFDDCGISFQRLEDFLYG